MALPFYNTASLDVISIDTEPIDLQDGQLMYDSTTNTIKMSSDNQVITIASGNGISYADVNSGTSLTYDNNNITWTSSASTPYMYDLNIFSLFENDELSIDFNGDIELDGKKEVNPSKIGLALLRAIESKLETSKKNDTITDICDV